MGKPGRGHTLSSCGEYIAARGERRGSETSQYLQEKKAKFDSVSSGERKRISPNQYVISVDMGLWGPDMGW